MFFLLNRSGGKQGQQEIWMFRAKERRLRGGGGRSGHPQAAPTAVIEALSSDLLATVCDARPLACFSLGTLPSNEVVSSLMLAPPPPPLAFVSQQIQVRKDGKRERMDQLGTHEVRKRVGLVALPPARGDRGQSCELALPKPTCYVAGRARDRHHQENAFFFSHTNF